MAKRILIIDDDRDIREALRSALEEGGYETSFAHDGRRALEYLRGGGRVDLILLDLMMPGLDGWDFRAEQKRDPRLSRIPVISLSAAGALVDAPSLRKPVQIDQLLRTVEDALR